MRHWIWTRWETPQTNRTKGLFGQSCRFLIVSGVFYDAHMKPFPGVWTLTAPGSAWRACVKAASFQELRVVLVIVLWTAATFARVHAADADNAIPGRIASPQIIPAASISNAIGARQRVTLVATLMLESEPGYLFVHDDTGNVRVHLRDAKALALKRGDLLEITGLPVILEDRPWLDAADIKPLGEGKIPAAVPIHARDAVKEIYDTQYVTVTGRVVGTNTYTLRGSTSEVLLIDSDGVLCKVMFKWGTRAEKLFPVGTVAEFTGISRLGGRVDESSTRYVHILAHGPEAVRVLQGPPFWNSIHWRVALGIIIAGAIAGGFWLLLQWRKVKLLRASEERFRALIENSFDATFVLSQDGSAKYASPSAVRMLGRSLQPGGTMNFSIADVVHPDDLPQIMAAHQDVLREPGRSRRVERYRVIAKDNSIRYAEAVGTNCLHVPGVEGVVVNVRDITERELARQEIERSELIQRRINEVAVSLSPLHTKEDILWEVTRRCIAVLGLVDCVIYLLDESRGVLLQTAAYGPKSPRGHEIVSPIEVPLGQGIVGSVAVTGQPEIITDTTKDPRYIVDDAPRLSEITVPIVANGRVIGVIDSEHPERGFFTQEHLAVLVSIASLTANKLVRARAESELQRLNEDLERRVATRTAELAETNARLRGEAVARETAEGELRVALAAEKELNQLKSSFVSMVSHEFRTPLEVILSSSNILDRYFERLPIDKRKAQLRAIRKSVHRMNDLVEDVLMLGKFDAGRMMCTPVPLDLNVVCRRIIDEVESAAERADAIRFHSEDINGDASADETLLVHILGNLLGNALKYSRSGSQVDFSIVRRGPDAEFIIHDRGCGIPASDRARLFTAFYRGGNVGQTPGTGLGLAIVKRCVELHHGAIRCESDEGQGTTFTVTLPLFDGTRRFRRKPKNEDQVSHE